MRTARDNGVALVVIVVASVLACGMVALPLLNAASESLRVAPEVILSLAVIVLCVAAAWRGKHRHAVMLVVIGTITYFTCLSLFLRLLPYSILSLFVKG